MELYKRWLNFGSNLHRMRSRLINLKNRTFVWGRQAFASERELIPMPRLVSMPTTVADLCSGDRNCLNAFDWRSMLQLAFKLASTYGKGSAILFRSFLIDDDCL